MMLGSQIRAARERAGMTRKELADAMGVSVSLVSKWEVDTRKPAAEELPRLATALGTSVSYLLDVAEAAVHVEAAAVQNSAEDLLRVWAAIQDRPDMQQFIGQLAEYDEDTIRRVLTALHAIVGIGRIT